MFVFSENFGAAYSAQTLSDHLETWHTCFLGDYLGVFFSFFQNFHFWAPGTLFDPNLWGSLQCPNIVGSSWNLVHLLFGWIPGGIFFIFSKFLFLGPRNPFWSKIYPNLWGSRSHPGFVFSNSLGWELTKTQSCSCSCMAFWVYWSLKLAVLCTTEHRFSSYSDHSLDIYVISY